MSNALKNHTAATKVARTETVQTKRTPGRTDEVRNNAGGYVFKVSDKDRLERFLILGTDGGTYYVGETKLTDLNVKFLKGLIKSDERMVVDTLVDIAQKNRAAKNTPSIFALALLLVEGEDKVYLRATDVVNKVVRTGTHLFEFANFIDDLGGWGRAKRNAIAGWYEGKTADQLAYQVVKYRQREGWTHRDLFRKVHPTGVNRGVGNFILGKDDEAGIPSLEVIDGFKAAQAAENAADVVKVLDTYKSLPWETLPTHTLNSFEVWEKLFYNGQLRGQALVRQITRLAKMGAFSNDLQFAADYAAKLADEENIRAGRMHPVAYLNAIKVYTDGQTPRGGNDYGYYGYGRQKSWTTEGVILDALNEAFHKSFASVNPAGKRTMLALDVSGSMGAKASGLELSCSEVSAAMAMTIARTEPAHIIRGFTAGSYGSYRRSANLTDLGITAKQSLATAMKQVRGHTFGGTDCAQPMLWALENKVAIDTFVVLTDNETWAGTIKPAQALVKYRKETGIDARLAVLGVASTGFTIADPADKGMMDFVGFDASAPAVLADFSAGRI